MDCTQALDDFHFEEPTQFKDGEKKQLGCLEVKGVKYAVFNGENRIGRGAECAISINSKALSKEHAVIEVVDADNHLLYDLGSRNKTRLGKMILQPDVRYQLANGAKLHLADVSAVYRRLPNGPEEEDDSGSETGSESMLTLNKTVVEDSVIVPETPGPSKIKQIKPLTVQESPSSVSDADSSFGFTGDKQKEKELFVKPKTLLDQSAKEGGEGDSIFDAKTLHPSTDSNKDESKDSIYEADTQCEVTDETDLTQNYDIYDAPTQRILNDTTKSVKAIDIYNAPTQCFLDDQSKTGTDKIDATSSCSEQTEDFAIEENSLSSNEDTTNKTEEGGNTTCIEQEKSKDEKSSAKQELNSSQNDDSFDRSLLEGDDDFFAFEGTQVHEKNTKKSSEVKEKIDIKSDKKPIDQLPSSSGSKSDDKKSSEIKDSTSSDQINSNREQHMNYTRRSDDMFLSQPLNSSLKTSNNPNTSAKTAHSNDSGDETDPEDIFDALTQPVGRLKKDAKATLNNGNKSPTKGNNDSGDETDPEAIFEAPTQTKESKSEPSTASEANKKFAVPSITGKGNNDECKTSVESKKAEEEDDIFEAATQVIQTPRKDENKLVKSPKGEVTESSEKRKDVPKITEISEKGKELPKPTPSEKSDKQKEFSKSSENNNKSKDLPKLSSSAKEIDDIFEAATQIVGTPSKSAFPSGKSPQKNKISPPPAIDAKKQVPSVSPPTKIENKDDIMEALTQKVEVPTKPSESSVSNSTVSSMKPSNHVNKDQDKVFKAPAKSKEHENQNLSSTLKKAPGTPMKASSKDNLDDDIFDLPTQKISEKLPSNKEIEKESKTEQQDQETHKPIKARESNLKKDKESKQAVLSKDSSKNAEDIYNAETQDIYNAETQDIFDADTQLIDMSDQEDEVESKLDNKSTKTGGESGDDVLKTQKHSDSSGIKPLNDDSKNIDVKILPSVHTTLTASPKRPVDSSVTQKEKVPEPVTKSNEFSKKPRAESSKDLNVTGNVKDNAETVVSKRSPTSKISDFYVKPVSQVKEVCTQSAVASKKVKETKKAEVVPSKASEISTKIVENKEAKIDVSEKKELDDSGKKSEKVVAEKSSKINKIQFSKTEENEPTEKSMKSSPKKETSEVPSKKDGKTETSAAIKENEEKKVIEEDDYIVMAPTRVMRVYEGKSGVTKVSKRVMIENESESAGKEEKIIVKQREETGKAKDKDLSERKEEGKVITEKGKYSSVEKGIIDSSAHTSEEINRAEVEINLNKNVFLQGESSEDVKIDDELDGTSDIKSLGFKTPEKKGRSNEDKKQEPKKPNEPAKSYNPNDSMELLLPESQELRDAKAAHDATSAQDTSEEDIPSYDESSPVVASKRLPVKRARVRKRFEFTPDETAPSSSRRRNAPEKKSTSKSSADVGTRSSRRRKQAEEPVESIPIGVRASKQRKLSEKDSAETVKEEEAEKEKNTDKENETSDTAQTPPKRQSRASGSNHAQKGGSTKQASKIPKRERASRNKNEKTEEEKKDSRKSEGQRTSGRRGQLQADSPNVKERITRGSRNAKKLEDVDNVPTASNRPSRERKMTWKVRESLNDSSQGSLEDDKPKTRSRGSSSNNSRSSSSQDLSVRRSSRSRTSTPLKKADVPASKPSTPRKSASSVKVEASEENKTAQSPTKAQKRKNKEDAAETPVKRSRREEQSHSEDSKEPGTRISGRRSKQQAEIKEVTSTGASRSTRRKPEAAVASPSCLKELNTSAVSGSSARHQRGSKRANTNIEEELPTSAKKRKQEKKPLKETPKQVVARSSRTRGKDSPQKQSAAETAESPKPAQRARTSRSSKTEEKKEDKTESPTPKTSSQRSRATRGKGTPQGINQSNVEGSSPRRSTPRKSAAATRTTYQVMFTGFSDTKQEAIVKQLGGSVVDVPDSCTVLVTDKVRRTYKFLCTVGRGKPIVSPEWLQQCRRSGSFIDPWQYIVKDQESETKFNFHLQESLELATRTNLLRGYSVHVTAKVKPPPSEMKGIIESCGGSYMTQAPAKSWPANSFTISCAEDKASWTKLKKSGKPIVGPEVLLLGVLQQKLDLKSNTLV